MKRRLDERDGESGGGGGGAHDLGEHVRVRSAEGEEVAWSRLAAMRSTALANWVNNTGGGEGAFATLVPAAALRTLSHVAKGGAEDGKALEGCSLAQLAQLLHGAHFLDVDIELLRLLSRTLCSGHLAGKSGPELGQLLGVESDYPTEAERQAATEEPIFTPDAPPNAPGATDAATPPATACVLTTQLDNEDALEGALTDADAPTLRALKGVSLAWRARARRVLCARLCARLGLPLTCNLVEVTEVNLSDSRAAGRLFDDAADASRGLPNLAKVTGLGGFEVDVAALRRMESSWAFYPSPNSNAVARVRGCIRGEGHLGPPMEVLLAACALRDGEAHLPENAFRDNTSMISFALPAGLRSIGKGAFSGCSSLTSIELPASITRIGAGAFQSCSSLTSVELPAGLTHFDGDNIFAGCSSLTSITLPAKLTRLFGARSLFWGCSSLTSVSLPAGLRSLGAMTFSGCSSLTAIELPAGITRIGSNAFENCSALTSMELPAGITRIGSDAFSGCTSLPKGFTLPNLD